MSRLTLVIIVAVVCAAGLASILLIASPAKESAQAVDFSSCRDKDINRLLDCWASQTNHQIEDGADPVILIAALDQQMLRSKDPNNQLCHTAMHTTGRWFAQKEKISLADLQNYIPRSDNSNCSAGFTHGMISVIGVNPNNVSQLITSCAKETTRARRTFCAHGIGHAFRRNFLDDDDLTKTIKACDQLGETASSDCAQGAFHDYLFAVIGLDDTKKLVKVDQALQRQGPIAAARICQDQPQQYQRECWFRVFYFYRSSFPVDGVTSLKSFCRKQAPKSANACFAAGVATFVEAYDYVTECQSLRGEWAEACYRGIYLKSLEVNGKKGSTPAAVRRRQQNIAFAMKRCLLMPDQRGERACAYWLSYYSVSGQSVSLSDRQALAICQIVNDQFKSNCRRAVLEAQRRDLKAGVQQ